MWVLCAVGEISGWGSTHIIKELNQSVSCQLSIVLNDLVISKDVDALHLIQTWGEERRTGFTAGKQVVMLDFFPLLIDRRWVHMSWSPVHYIEVQFISLDFIFSSIFCGRKMFLNIGCLFLLTFCEIFVTFHFCQIKDILDDMFSSDWWIHLRAAEFL